MNPMMNLKECADAMRDVGFRTSETCIADGIESGRYPFGALLSVGQTGRRRFEIYRVDFEAWLRSKTGGAKQ